MSQFSLHLRVSLASGGDMVTCGRANANWFDADIS